MKRIATFLLLAALALACSSPAFARKDNTSIGENSQAARKAAKQQRKASKKLAKQQRKAAKKYQKQQRRAGKQQSHTR